LCAVLPVYMKEQGTLLPPAGTGTFF